MQLSVWCIPLSKSSPPFSTLRVEAAVGKSQTLYWRLKVPLGFSQIHPQTAFLGLWKNSSISNTFFLPRWLEKRYQVPAGLQQGWSSLKKRCLGNSVHYGPVGGWHDLHIFVLLGLRGGIVKALDDCLKLWEGSCGRNMIVMSKAG